jgi:hypothetical protein
LLRRLARIAAPVIALSAAVAVSSVPAAHAVIPLKGKAMITKTKSGYLFRAGQQDSHLVIKHVSGGIRFADSGTGHWKSLPSACHRQTASKGIAAVCHVPATVSSSHPMTLQIWVRLGDDYVNGSSLPHAFRLSVLADAGNDTVYGGAGNDFVNGAQNNDRVYGGPGNDWIRTGIGNDKLWGGSGNDKLVGQDGRDRLYGGDGADRLYGSNGHDVLYGQSGSDKLNCGSGADVAHRDGADRRTRACESVTR